MSLRKSNAESPGVEVDGFSSNTNISSSEGMSIFGLVFCRVTFISGMDCFLGSEGWIAGAIAASGGFWLLACTVAFIGGRACGGDFDGGFDGGSAIDGFSKSSKSAPEASFSFHERISARVMPSARLMAVSALILSSGISATTWILPELR